MKNGMKITEVNLENTGLDMHLQCLSKMAASSSLPTNYRCHYLSVMEI